MKLILASSSPRRKEILEKYGYEFDIVLKPIDETMNNSKSPENNVKRIAEKKCDAVSVDYPNDVVISCDTVVVLGEKIYGKPKTKEEALETLGRLNGITHEVLSGVCIKCGKTTSNFVDRCKVTFKNLTNQEIEKYVDSGEPFGKAGAYAIQGIGIDLIEKYEGDINTIIGLPILKVKPLIDSLLV